jgi:hypothetical protein
MKIDGKPKEVLAQVRIASLEGLSKTGEIMANDNKTP